MLFLFLLFGGLYFAKGFLLPVVFAALFAMLFLPLTEKLERKGWNRAIAILVCIAGLLLLFAGMLGLLAWQITDLAKDAGQIEQKITGVLNKLRTYVSQNLGVPEEKQQELIKKQQEGGTGKISNTVNAILGGAASVLGNSVLMLVYLFLFVYMREHLRSFVLKLVPEDQKGKAITVMNNSTQVAQKYISGLAMMIACLWVMYGIGFSIVGVKHALFFAVLCGLLEIVPFVGNITGTAITLIMVLVQGGDGGMVAGVLSVYVIVQFLQTYILEPLVVGANVNINPLFTILIIIVGEMVWGIPGMIVAIPVLAVVKIIFDHIPEMKPYGALIGQTKEEKEEPGLTEKIKKLFKK